MLKFIFILIPVIFSMSCSSSSQRTIKVHDRTPIYLEDIYGKSYQLNSITENKNIALIFWQTWCSECSQQAPEIAKAAHEYKNIEFFGVISGPDSIVNNQKVIRIANELHFSFPQIRDRLMSHGKRFNITNTPTTVILGKNMKILYHNKNLPKWKRFN